MVTHKLKAALIHFSFCVGVALVVLSLVYLGWYQGVLSETQKIGPVLLIVLGVDVVLGPLLTFIVYKRGKKSLKFDLCVIALVQLFFLAYGLNAVYRGRPTYIVFVLDRFEVVKQIDWPDGAEKDASVHAKAHLLKPTIVGANLPTDPKERSDLVLSSASGGADVSALPKYYVSYDEVKAQVIAQAKPLADLKQFNPTQHEQINQIARDVNVAAEDLRFLPLKGSHKDAAVIIKRSNAELIKFVNLQPWQ
jgi:hypothetical protein